MNKKRYTGSPSIPNSRARVLLKKKISELTNTYILPANKIIKEMVKNNIPISIILERIDSMNDYIGIQYESQIKNTIRKWAYQVDESNKNIIETNIARSLGVDNAAIIKTESVKRVLDAFEQSTIQLIKSIPSTNLSKVSQAVIANYTGAQITGNVSLMERISDIGNITLRRGAFIARDQTASLNSMVNQQRNEDCGIRQYIWRTSEDERVVGDPTGLYPKASRAHGNHYARDNKIFSWDKPPFDGHPGIAINCRCTAKAYINQNDLDNVTIY